jgi:hypothetical protein
VFILSRPPLEDGVRGRMWSSTSLQISLSSMVEGLNISGCEAAMEVEKGFLCA